MSLETGDTKRDHGPRHAGQGGRAAVRAPGYHRLRLANREITLAVAPPRCLTFGDVAPGAKLWGLAVQLYSLRRPDDDGFGDAGALADLVESAAREGADAIALSPTHSLFAADPAHFGPYSPSSRLFLNPLFADPTLVFGAARVAAARGEHRQPGPQRRRIDRLAGRGTRKIRIAAPAVRRFRRERRAVGGGLRVVRASTAAIACASTRCSRRCISTGSARRSRNGIGTTGPPTGARRRRLRWLRFAAAERRAIEFHLFLQWLAARSFARVQQDARDAGMRIGLISDLAIGMSPGGSHAWSRQQDLLLGLNVGAPPDLFNTRGQDWGLTGFSPQALIASGFEPFIATLRAAMRMPAACGSITRWVWRGSGSFRKARPRQDGAYLAYPVDDLLRLLALESHRHRAVVIAEDLGTVEPAFRKRLAKTGIAGMDVLWFQRRGKSFLAPARWRRDAVAMTTTHDLPTVAGWWQGADIATRDALGLVADEQRETQERAQDRSALWGAFRKAGEAAADAPPSGRFRTGRRCRDRLHGAVARVRSR